jgi:hypothetical protein
MSLEIDPQSLKLFAQISKNADLFKSIKMSWKFFRKRLSTQNRLFYSRSLNLKDFVNGFKAFVSAAANFKLFAQQENLLMDLCDSLLDPINF